MSRKSQLEGRLLSILQPHVARRVFSGRGVAIACALAVAVIVPVSALRLIAEPNEQTATAQQAKTETTTSTETTKSFEAAKASEAAKSSGSEVTVTPHVESLEDYFLAKLGKYDKRADRWTRTPKNGSDWYERAYDLYRADRYEEAAVAFKRAASEGHNQATALYNAACSYALLGDADRAIPTLSDAIDAGWDDIDKIADDSDFDPIRSDPRFARAVRDQAGEVVNRRLNETMEQYKELRAGTSGDDDWYDVGLDLLRLRKFDDSIYAFQKSIENGEKTGAAMYNIACAYSLRGDVRNGMIWLEKSIDNGFSSDDKLENDPDIALLRQQSAFPGLRQRAEDLEMRTLEGKFGRVVKAVFNWGDSVEHHRRMTQKYPNSGRAWFNLGYTALQDRDFETAMAAFQKTLVLGYRVGTSSYNMACAYALQGNRDAAFVWLDRARAANFDLDDHIDDDDDLDSLHRDPRWKKLTDDLNLHEKDRWNTKNHKHKDG